MYRAVDRRYYGPGFSGNYRKSTAYYDRKRRAKALKGTWQGYTRTSVPRAWPPNELTATLEGSYKFRMDTAATAFPNTGSAFQCFGFGGDLDTTSDVRFVTGGDDLGTGTNATAIAFPVHTQMSPLYTRMAVLATSYKITFSSTHEVPNGFKIYSWVSDYRFVGVPNLTDTGELRVTGDPDIAGMPADPTAQLSILDRNPRILRPMVYTNLSVDSSTNRATIYWKPNWSTSRSGTGKGPAPKAINSANHPSGIAGLQNAAIASALSTNFGMRPHLNVMICRRNLGGDATPDRTTFITHCEVHVRHKVCYFERIAG